MPVRPVTRALLIALAVAVAVAVASTLAAYKLRDDLAASRAQVRGYQEAARKLDDHLKFVKAERQKWQEAAEALAAIEGSDEPLNPYMRAVLDRVRQGQRNP